MPLSRETTYLAGYFSMPGWDGQKERGSAGVGGAAGRGDGGRGHRGQRAGRDGGCGQRRGNEPGSSSAGIGVAGRGVTVRGHYQANGGKSALSQHNSLEIRYISRRPSEKRSSKSIPDKRLKGTYYTLL